MKKQLFLIAFFSFTGLFLCCKSVKEEVRPHDAMNMLYSKLIRKCKQEGKEFIGKNKKDLINDLENKGYKQADFSKDFRKDWEFRRVDSLGLVFSGEYLSVSDIKTGEVIICQICTSALKVETHALYREVYVNNRGRIYDVICYWSHADIDSFLIQEFN